jgi:two-component system cell cycle sensor histidine kinase/response regulator CckA
MNVVTQFPAPRNYERDLRFQAMFEGAAIGFGFCQLDGRILEANPAFCRMLGYSRQELTTTHAHELYPELDPEFHRQNTCEIFPGNFIPGSPFPGSLSPTDQRLGEVMRGERESFEVEKHYRRKDGSEFWGHLTLSVARDERRQPAFLIAMLRDATENNRMREFLREAEKMEVIGRLAAGIVHDFNNLLTGVLLYCDLLSAGFENAGVGNAELARSELNQYLEEVRMASEQGAALTHQLLAIARRRVPETRPTPINEIVATTKNLLRRLLGEQIELIIVLDSALDPALDRGLDSALDLDAGLVLADPAQLRQIILNLVLNARDAMPQGGKIALITRAVEFPSRPLDDLSRRLLDDFEPGATRRAVSLVVKDNGCGMDAETRARLFEPFFTTKKPGEGTGLGLATVQRIVGELGGVIEVESEPRHGTSIEVFLPAIKPATDDIQRVKTDSS